MEQNSNRPEQIASQYDIYRIQLFRKILAKFVDMAETWPSCVLENTLEWRKLFDNCEKGFNDPEPMQRANIPIPVDAQLFSGHWGH